ncbi:hypothetical protein ASZ90_015344 [hydrocarbon metagenome]|uniref:Uncharacterized protein n=1 Tax=hydrocarbon metagenome TaxID=938273 RepID=A0A0W8F292_9ZZZZ
MDRHIRGLATCSPGSGFGASCLSDDAVPESVFQQELR